MTMVLIVDDDPFNIDGLQVFLQQRGLTAVSATTAAEAWKIAAEHPLDLAIVDIVIPEAADHQRHLGQSVGIRLALRLRTLHPQLPIILFSAYEDRGLEIADLIHQSLRGFAYKLKGCTADELYQTILQVQAGQVVLDADVTNISGLAEVALTAVQPDERLWVESVINAIPQLTPREQQIAEAIAAGHRQQHIADTLTITHKTVENHTGNIYKKLGLAEMGEQAPHLRQNIILAKAFLIYDLARQR